MKELLKKFIQTIKPRNYKFIGYIALYILFVTSIGMIIMGQKQGIEWTANLIELLSCLGGIIGLSFLAVSTFTYILKKKELILSSKIQWWILVISEGMILLKMFCTSSPVRHDLENLNTDALIVYVYLWISLVPVLFAAIHLGSKIAQGYRVKWMTSSSYQRLQSIYRSLLDLSFFVSIMLAVGYKSYAQESALFINYFVSFFVIIGLNQLILKIFYMSQDQKNDEHA